MSTCSLCGAPGRTSRSCPFNVLAINPKPSLHNATRREPVATTTGLRRRRQTDYQWSELVFVAKLLYPVITSRLMLLQMKDTLESDPRVIWTNFDDYWLNLESASDREVGKYLSNIPNTIDLMFVNIYLEGKNVTNDEIISLNSTLNSRQKKADIYIKYTDRWEGISIKKCGKCTLTNYSVEKICREGGLTDVSHEIKRLRIQMLLDKFGKDYRKDYNRSIINTYLTDKTIGFWSKTEEAIGDVNIQKKYIDALFPEFSYNCYEYNGSTYRKLTSKPSNWRIERAADLDTLKSAKIWYKIYIDDIPKYTFEVRGKNDLYKGSMQILTYKLS